MFLITASEGDDDDTEAKTQDAIFIFVGSQFTDWSGNWKVPAQVEASAVAASCSRSPRIDDDKPVFACGLIVRGRDGDANACLNPNCGPSVSRRLS